jgi:hypothetical protein
MMTNWFPTGTAPVRDGCYIVRLPNSTCQHFCRWDVKTKRWYSAGSTGRSKYDIMGFRNSVDTYEWRGLNKPSAL